MKTKMVRNTRESLQKPTQADVDQLKALADMPDSEIDFTDAPPIPIERWKAEGVRGRFYRPVKEAVTARIDSDVVAWLKEAGDGYQTRMNAILRREMVAVKGEPIP